MRGIKPRKENRFWIMFKITNKIHALLDHNNIALSFFTIMSIPKLFLNRHRGHCKSIANGFRSDSIYVNFITNSTKKKKHERVKPTLFYTVSVNELSHKNECNFHDLVRSARRLMADNVKWNHLHASLDFCVFKNKKKKKICKIVIFYLWISMFSWFIFINSLKICVDFQIVHVKRFVLVFLHWTIYMAQYVYFRCKHIWFDDTKHVYTCHYPCYTIAVLHGNKIIITRYSINQPPRCNILLDSYY